MAEQPTGTVTLLFTDIEGSTRLLNRLGTARYGAALDLHRRLLRASFERHNGYEVDHEGDAFFVAFADPHEAVAAAAEAQQTLAEAEWPAGGEIRVRMGLHTGEPLATPGRYVGIDVHKAARIMAAGHGGQVLVSASTQQLVGSDVDLRSLGEHLLKDLMQPEPLYQVVISELPSQFPALKTLGNRPTNLPVQPNALIGRETELEAVTLLLRDPASRLVTLTGVGGSGKTRLALHAAAELLEDFSAGVYFVSLAPIRDAALVVPAIAEALFVREVPGEEIVETLNAYLEPKQLLLVVDNFEQVIEAAGEIGGLVARCPRVKVLATSRERLRLRGERTYPVPPLPVATEHASLDELLENEAARLFVTRAADVVGGFSIDERTAPVVAEICRRLDGLPLAIELAAARIAALTPQAILQRLDRRLALLTGGDRDVDERQRTLRAAIAWSHDLLPVEERALLARLSVFVDGCRLVAAERVAAGLRIDPVDGLTSLIEKNLLHRRRDPDGESRYWLLETIREFAAEQLEADAQQRGQSASRHALATLDLATILRARLRAAGAQEASKVFAAESANVRAALAFAAATFDGSLYVRLTDAASMFWYLSGRVSEGVAYAEQALVFTEVLGDTERATVLPTVVFLRSARGDSTDALLPLADQGVALAEQLGDWTRLLWALDAKGAILQTAGRPEQSVEVYRRLLAVASEHGDNWFQMVTGLNLSNIALEHGRYTDAVGLAESAAEQAHALGDQASLAIALENKGAALAAQGDMATARPLLEDAARAAGAVDYGQALAGAVVVLALVSLRGRCIDSAARLVGYVDHILDGASFVLGGFERRAHDEVVSALNDLVPSDRLASLRAEGRVLGRAGRLADVLEHRQPTCGGLPERSSDEPTHSPESFA